jgi:PIN domain nuclease of toxin-antitoxin system
VNESRIVLLNLELEHLKINASLPFPHRDPFDRIIIAQSMAENLPIITMIQFSVNIRLRLFSVTQQMEILLILDQDEGIAPNDPATSSRLD